MNTSQMSCGYARILFDVRVRVAGAGLSSPDAWIGSDDSAKDPREVRLITHPTLECDLRQRCTRTQHERLRALDALPCNVGKGWLAEALSESPEEMPDA